VSSSSLPPRTVANEPLVAAIKAIVALARAGDLDTAYDGYRALFGDPSFSRYDPQDRRRALRLVVHAREVPTPPTRAMVAAHRAAIAPLEELVAQHGEPADYEMLGMCHVVVTDEAKAGEVFRAGLAIERQRDLQSDLCGAFMRRISML
jgi:hypothetical protein